MGCSVSKSTAVGLASAGAIAPMMPRAVVGVVDGSGLKGGDEVRVGDPSSTTSSSGGRTVTLGGKTFQRRRRTAATTSQLQHFSTANLSRLVVYHERFKRANPDGDELDREQFATALSECGLKSVVSEGEEILSVLFEQFDTDRSNTVTFGELCAGLAQFVDGSLDQKLRFCFQVFDVDHDESISKKEMADMLKAVATTLLEEEDAELRRLAQGFVHDMFPRVDLNDDGELSLEEYLIAAKNDAAIAELFTLGSRDLKTDAPKLKKVVRGSDDDGGDDEGE